MDNLQSILFSVGSAIGTVTVILGIGRFLGRKESSLERLEKAETVGHVAIDCHRKLDCPYGNEFGFLRTSISELKKDVGTLDGKVEGVKTTIEFIGDFIRNGKPSNHRDAG